MTAAVSVIVPAYDVAVLLPAALASIRAQDEAVELIVVDDGSHDDGAAAAAAAGARVLRQANAGPAAARNAGLAVARGDWLAFLDADDCWPAGSLAVRLATLRAHPDVAFVQGRLQDVWPGLDGPGRDRIDPPRWGFNLGAALFRRAVFDALGGFDPALRTGEDVDLLVRAAAHGLRRARIADVTLLYRRRLVDELDAHRRHVRNLAHAVKRTLDARRRAE